MAVNNITQTITEIPMAGKRGIDVQTIFVNKQEAFQDALTEVFVGQINILRTQLNTFAGQINTTATQINTDATSASTSASTATTKASEASASASQALTSRNQAETFAQQASASAVSVDATNIVYRTGNQTIAGVKTFSSDIVGSITGNATTATKLATTRNIALSGDVTGNVNFDGTGNVNIATTIAPNSILLGTDTTGNYVAGNTAGTGITVSGTAGEGWSPTISLTNVGAAGTYKSVTTDAQGRVTSGTNPTTLSGYGITDAATALRTTATFTTVADSWYRIATSVIGIGRNSAEFVVDWTVSGNHGSTRFAAACHYGEATGVSLMQTNYSKYGTSGITEARIVYHTIEAGNYAYVEVKFAGALTNVTVNVEMQDPLGWTLVTPSTAGSIPAGYSSYLHTFVPSAAITAGTYPKVTINQEGRVISGTTLVATDIPVLDASKITTGTLPVLRGGTGVTTSTGTGNVVLSTSPTLVTPNIGVATAASISSYGVVSGKSTLNDYNGAGIETLGNGVSDTVFPTIGFHQIGLYASSIQLRAGGDFRFYSQGGIGYANVTANQFNGSLTGNAGTATTLQTARTIGASGDVTGTAQSFNGSANITIPMTLANSGVTAGTYSKMTVDAKGRVTAGFTQTMEDIPDATFKRSVKAATTANITLNAPQTIDGVALVAGDRVLVKNQTTPSGNGIYVVAAGAWTRALDADTSSKISSALVAVDTGTINGGKLFDTDFKTTDTLGTTAMTWSMNLDDGALLTSGSTSIGIVKYNGTTAAAGQFDGGTTTPTGSTRLNYGGYFYPTYVNLLGTADTATASSHVFVETASDGYIRPKTLANFKTEMFTSPTLVTPNIGVATGTSFNSITGLATVAPLAAGTATVGTSTLAARQDHIHPTDTTRAPLASPVFTGAPNLPTGTIGVTQAITDNSTKLATTAFVKSSPSNKGFEIVTTNRVLTVADIDKVFFIGASNVTFTFPNSTTLPSGSKFTILSSGGISPSTFAGSTFVNNTGDVFTTSNGYNFELYARTDTNQYRSAQTSNFSGPGVSSLASSGYQKLPSGLIIQWGNMGMLDQTYNVTFPIAFPNTSPVALTISHMSANTLQVYKIGTVNPSTTGFTAVSEIDTNGSSFGWIAIGF